MCEQLYFNYLIVALHIVCIKKSIVLGFNIEMTAFLNIYIFLIYITSFLSHGVNSWLDVTKS